MNLTILQENLLPKLQDASRFVSSKPQLPILSGVYLSSDKGSIVLRTTDLKVGYQTILGGKIEEEGTCVVPIRYLTELIASLHPGPLTVQTEGNSLIVTQGKVKSTLTTFPPIDFPPFPESGQQLVTLPKEKFSQAIERVFYAASLDETRPVIASILVKLTEDGCIVAATDGYRLAVETIEGQYEQERTLLIQAKLLAEIARVAIKTQEKEISVSILEDLAQAIFSLGDTTMMIRLTEGTFPNYKAIIPPVFTLTTKVERESFIHAVKTAMVIAKESSSIITLDIAKKTIRIAGASQSIGENTSEVESSYAGDEGKTIACNAKFLLDCVSRLQSDEIELSLNEELKPIRIREADNDNFVYIVMPFKK